MHNLESIHTPETGTSDARVLWKQCDLELPWSDAIASADYT